MGAASHPRILSVAEGQRSVLVWVVKADALLQKFVGRGKFSETLQSNPQGIMRLYKELGVLRALGQGEKLFP